MLPNRGEIVSYISSDTFCPNIYIRFLEFPVLLVLDKRELKEWKKMVEKQLTEKVSESLM